MSQRSARGSAPEQAALRTASLPFSAIPRQSRLFLDYVREPAQLREFYPNAVQHHSEIIQFIPTMLARYSVDRGELCSALGETNPSPSAETRENIRRLAKSDTVAVVTGQQAGLFTGPLYTIYKAISAIRMAEMITARGIQAVPVFWAATEDHDFDEVSDANLIGSADDLFRIIYRPASYTVDIPVGRVGLEADIERSIDQMFAELSQTEFSSQAREIVHESWRRGATFGGAFSGTLSRLLGKYGLVMLDPMNERLKKLAAPIYAAATNHSDAITASVITKRRELEAEGYAAQVSIEPNYFPLFWHYDTGRRTAVRRIRAGIYAAKDSNREFDRTELEHSALNEPARFSPGVMLRPVVQDFLLPTACYFGGAAEVAYFAQNSEVYRTLDRPVTPILHRQSFTVVEPRQHRAMEKLGLGITDLFDGMEAARLRVASHDTGRETARLFADAEEKINTEMNRLDQAVSQIDVTLAYDLAKRRRKIVYHIGASRRKALMAQLRKDETTSNRLEAVFSSLYPHGQLQERTLNVFTYINRYGTSFIDWIYDAVDLNDRGHRVVNL